MALPELALALVAALVLALAVDVAPFADVADVAGGGREGAVAVVVVLPPRLRCVVDGGVPAAAVGSVSPLAAVPGTL